MTTVIDPKPARVKCESCNVVVINGHPCHETGCHGSFIFTKNGRQYQQWTVWSLDVWGNEKDGFEVNDRSRCGEILLDFDAPDNKLIRKLKRAGHLAPYSKRNSYHIYGDDGLITIDWAQTGEPLLTLERQ